MFKRILKLVQRMLQRRAHLPINIVVAIFSGLAVSFFILSQPVKAATRTWDGGGANNNWSTCANWSNDVCPVAADTVIFDATSAKDSTIDATAPNSISVMTIASTYSGTITLAKTFTISSFSEAGGAFAGASQALTINSFSLSGGSFTASTATTVMNGAFTVTGGSFAHNSGTVRFSGSNATLSCNNIVFNLVSFTGQSGTKTVSSNCSLPLGAAPNIPGTVLLSGTLSGSGTLTAGDNLTFNATAVLSGFSGMNHTGGIITLTNYSGSFESYSPFTVRGLTVTAGDLTLPPTATTTGLTMSSGTLTSSSSLLTIGGSLSLSGSVNFVHNGGAVTFTGSGPYTIACSNQVFNQVAISWNGNGGGTISSDCNLPLGNNPTITNGSSSRVVTLNGTLSGTGTLTFTSSAGTGLTIGATGVLSGFTGISSSGIFVTGANVDLSTYSPLTVGVLSITSGTLTVASGLDTSNSLIITGGTFNAPSGNLTIGGSFVHAGSGVFNANGGTVIFDGSTVTLTCNSTLFNKVVLSTVSQVTVSGGCTLPLGNNATMSGDVALAGVLTGSGTLTHNSGELTATGGSITGFSEINGSGNSLTVTSSHLNLGSLTRVQMTSHLMLSNASSTLTAPALLEVGGSVVLGSGTFNANGGTLNLFGSTASITCNNHTFSTVTFTGQTGVKTVGSNCPLPLGNNPVIPTSITTSSVLSGSGLLTMTAGSLTFNAGGTLSGFSGLTGTSNYITVAGGTVNLSSYSPFSLTGNSAVSSGTLTLPNNAQLNGNLSLSGGTLASTAGNVNITGNLTGTSGTINAPSGILTVGGQLSLTSTAAFVHNSGTVNLTGASETLACNNAVFNLVTLNNSGLLTINSTCNFPLGSNPTIPNAVTLSGTLSGSGTLGVTTGTLTLNSTAVLSGFSGLAVPTLTSSLATFNASAYTTFTTSGLFTISTGTVTLPNGANVAGLTMSGASNVAGTTGDVTINGNLTISTSGTFTAPSGSLNLSGNFGHASGTFTHNGGTVNMNGGSQSFTGLTTSFNNLTKQLIGAQSQTLTFVGSGGVTYTVNGAMVLKGYDESNRLLLRSSSVSQFRISPLGTRDLLYLDVKDGNNVSGTSIQMGGTGSLDSTNNTNFNFGSLTPNDPTGLGPSSVISGVVVPTSRPAFSFTLSDPNVLDTVKYQIQISAASDFSNPVVDYTSALGTQVLKSFTVGQSPGSGSYTVGSLNQTLATGSYYWRVRTFDNNGLNSNYVAGNSGSMAFIVDADAPAAFTPTLDVTSPTTNVTPIISFATTDNVAIDHYTVRINSGITQTVTSPYQLPTLAEGSNTLTVRAYDTSNNYAEAQLVLVVDYSQPEIFTPTLDVSSPTSNTAPVVSFSTTDNDGLDHYEVKVDSGSFSTQVSPYQLPTLAGGSHTITVRAFDSAGNTRDGSVSVTVDVTPPNSFTPSLNVSSPTSNSQPTITFSTNDNIAVSYYQVKVDDGAYATRTSPYQLPVLELGPHTITVKAVDTVGNERTGWVDVTIVSAGDSAPAAFTPTFSPGAYTTSTTPSVSFTTTDDFGVSRYEVKIDDGAFSVQTSPYQLPTLSEGGHLITVRAFDTTEQSTDGSATVTVDLTAPAAFSPSFTVSSPTNDATPTLTFSSTDAVGIHHYEIRVDAGSFISHSSPYTIPTQGDGEHLITVRAFDAAGNYQEGTTSIVTDATAPAIFTPTFNVTSPTTDSRPIISFATTDASGVDYYQVKVNSGSFSTQVSPYQLPTLTEGSYTVTVRAYDVVGNSRDQSVEITVDLNGPDPFTPTLNVTSPSNNTAPTLSFSTTDSDGVDHYEVKVDDGVFGPQVSPYQLPTLSEGSHTFTVRAFDALQNITEGIATLTVDLTGPNISVSAPAKVAHADITTTVVTVTDTQGILVADVDITGATSNCTQTFATQVRCTLVIVASGDVNISATDRAGNNSTATETGYLIETTAPVISVTAPTKVTLAAIMDTTIQVTDNYGILSSGVVAISGGTISCTQTSASEVNCSSVIRYSGELVINVLDIAGNAAAHTESGYEISNTPPQSFTPTLNTETITKNRTPVLFFATTDTDGLSYYEVQIDGGSFAQQVSPYQVPTLDDGDHTFVIRAFDTYGNFTEGEVSLTVDSNLPDASPSPTPTSTPTPTPSSTPAASPEASPTPTPSPTVISGQPSGNEPPSDASPLPSSTLSDFEATPSGQASPSAVPELAEDGTSLISRLGNIWPGAAVNEQVTVIQASLASIGLSNDQVVSAVQSIPNLGAALVVGVQVATVGVVSLSVVSQVGAGSLLQMSTFSRVLAAAGILPRKKRHGLVFESRTGQPIPFATLSVYSADTDLHEIVATLVTDVNGCYQEPFLKPGTYSLEAAHSQFGFPSRYSRPWHLRMADYYQGQNFEVKSSQLTQPLFIPMDASLVKSLKSDWRTKVIFIQRLLVGKLSWLRMPLMIIAILNAVSQPTPFTVLVSVLYGAANVGLLWKRHRKPSIKGRLYLQGPPRQLSPTRITLSQADGLAIAVTDSNEWGKFEFYVPPGEYQVQISATDFRLSSDNMASFVSVNTLHKGSQNLRLRIERVPEMVGISGVNTGTRPTLD